MHDKASPYSSIAVKMVD